jgi:hypothetical protein
MTANTPVEETRQIEGRDDQAAGVRPRIEVPVACVTIQPLAWEDDEQVSRSLRFVTVDANLAEPETVSVVLSSPVDPELSYPERDPMVFFDLEPLDALALADELRRAAEESVVPCPCGRTLANMRDYSDVCLFQEHLTT